MDAPTNVSYFHPPEILEDGVGMWSLLRFPVPALLGDLPDLRSHSRGFKGTRHWRSRALRDLDDDTGIVKPGKGFLSCGKLEGNTIRTCTCHTFGNRRASTMTIDNEYISDSFVAFFSPAVTTPISRSSGAR